MILTDEKEKKPKKKTEEEKNPDAADVSMEELDDTVLLSLINGAESKESKPRIMGIYGDITSEKCADAIYHMLILKDSGKQFEKEDPEEEDSKEIEVYEPFQFLLSTFGGSALDMFAVYDMMRLIKKDCDIETMGLGKVMSAGVLLLAAGTKGKRKIGASCRVMIHGVISGQHGHLHDLKNEMEEAKVTEKMYVEALASETKMSAAYIRRLIKKRSNIYLDAKKALELGIVDEII
tara:strand:- start:1171 stop:1875 length:705 start_codon:yes stop_codon:yes gene_type:complete